MTAPDARPAERLSGITPSRIRTVYDRAAELEARGTRVVHFETGWPPRDVPVLPDGRGSVRATPRAGVRPVPPGSPLAPGWNRW